MGGTETRVASSIENINLRLPAWSLQKARWLELELASIVLLMVLLIVSPPSHRGLRILYIVVQGLCVLVGLVSE